MNPFELEVMEALINALESANAIIVKLGEGKMPPTEYHPRLAVVGKKGELAVRIGRRFVAAERRAHG